MMQRTLPIHGVEKAVLLRVALVLGGVSGASGVLLMALSAHVDTTGLLKTAAEMLLFHAPVFLVMGAMSQVRKVLLLPVAMTLVALGLSLFSGDLASRAFLDQRLFPMAAPSGGVLLILGWATIALGALRISANDA